MMLLSGFPVVESEDANAVVVRQHYVYTSVKPQLQTKFTAVTFLAVPDGNGTYR